MRNRFSDRQSEKASRSIVSSLDGRSNVTNPRDRQVEKQCCARRRAEVGIAIERSDRQKENAADQMSHSKEWASNATNSRAQQASKHLAPRLATFREIKTAERGQV
jgi:hypothetical protein